MSVCRENSLDEKLHRKIPTHAPKKNTGLFTEKYPHMHQKIPDYLRKKCPHMHQKIPDYLRPFAEVPRLTTSIFGKIRRNLKQCILYIFQLIPFCMQQKNTILSNQPIVFNNSAVVQ